MIELGKKYRTQDGRDVRIYAVDGGGQHPVHGAIKSEGIWHMYAWRFNGEYTTSDCADLIEVKPERWYPVVTKGEFLVVMSSCFFDTRKEAMAYDAESMGGWTVIDAWLDPRSGK